VQHGECINSRRSSKGNAKELGEIIACEPLHFALLNRHYWALCIGDGGEKASQYNERHHFMCSRSREKAPRVSKRCHSQFKSCRDSARVITVVLTVRKLSMGCPSCVIDIASGAVFDVFHGKIILLIVLFLLDTLQAIPIRRDDIDYRLSPMEFNVQLFACLHCTEPVRMGATIAWKIQGYSDNINGTETAKDQRFQVHPEETVEVGKGEKLETTGTRVKQEAIIKSWDKTSFRNVSTALSSGK
jgi:hypothetical protein